MAVKHAQGCEWNADDERCTCGALFLCKAYRFANGNIIAFDQFGKQMPYYQARSDAADRIGRDYPHIQIRPGKMIK